MGKIIQQGYWLRLAPGIIATQHDTGTYEIIDNWEKNRETTRVVRYLDPHNIDDKIIIYERQVKKWFLERASRIKSSKYTGFIVLMIAISYVEGVQAHMDGMPSNSDQRPEQERGSRNCFVKGMKRIFGFGNEYNSRLKIFYDQVRCGLFHTGMTKDLVQIRSAENNPPVTFSEEGLIIINHKAFLDIVKQDFDTYLTDLRNEDNRELRRCFNRMFRVTKVDE